MLCNEMTQEIDFIEAEPTLCHDEVVVSEALEKLDFVLFGVPAGHQDVVNVDKCTVKALTDSVHQSLERLGRVLKAKWHPEKLEQPKWGDNGSFQYV